MALVLEIIRAFLLLVEAGVAITPSIVAAAKTAWDLLQPGALPPTDAQKAEMDAALEDAHNALQAAQPAP